MWMQKFYKFAQLKSTFSILHFHLSKTLISVYLLYTLFSLNNHFIFFFYYFNNLTSQTHFLTFLLWTLYSLSLSLSLSLSHGEFSFFFFFLSSFFTSQYFFFRPFFHQKSINKLENSINKPKIFTSTQTHVNLSPFWLDLAMVARQMWRQQ